MGRSQVCVYIASSLDGFIAGEDDDPSWLPTDVDPSMSEPGALGYEQFMEGVGALLMGRRTYDVVRSFGVEWPYGERPVLVATGRPLDGGDLIRQAAEADLIDEVTLTLVPVALGRGRALFAGLNRPYPMEVLSHHTFAGGMVQLRCSPDRSPARG